MIQYWVTLVYYSLLLFMTIIFRSSGHFSPGGTVRGDLAIWRQPKARESIGKVSKAERGDTFRPAAPSEGTWPLGESQKHWKALEEKAKGGADSEGFTGRRDNEHLLS